MSNNGSTWINSFYFFVLKKLLLLYFKNFIYRIQKSKITMGSQHSDVIRKPFNVCVFLHHTLTGQDFPVDSLSLVTRRTRYLFLRHFFLRYGDFVGIVADKNKKVLQSRSFLFFIFFICRKQNWRNSIFPASFIRIAIGVTSRENAQRDFHKRIGDIFFLEKRSIYFLKIK